MADREVVLIDMDCFYVQVEQRLDPSLKGKPCAVVQYKTYRGGGIIAVGYEARAFGVTRQMCGDEAKEKCPDVQLARVPETRGKADLTRYREAGAEVIAVFSKFCSCVERASVDEAFLDVTEEVTRRLKALGDSQVMFEQIPNTFVEGYTNLEGTSEWLKKLYSNKETYESECRLAVAASMVEEMRAAVLTETGFTCSAGISNNKMLAKFACGRNKPNKQTVLPKTAVQSLFETLPLQKIRHLGGKLGAFLVDELGLKNMWDLTKFSEQELQKYCGAKTGSWLYGACRGIELEPVAPRVLPKSIGCSKNFRGKEMLDSKEKVKFWLSELSEEVSERLNRDKELHKRTAKSLTVSVYYKSVSGPVAASRACALVRYDAEKISSDAYCLLQQFNTSSSHSQQWVPPLMNLGLSASKFTDCGNHQKINSMFRSAPSSQTTISFTKQSPAVTHGNTEMMHSLAEGDLLPQLVTVGGADHHNTVEPSMGLTEHQSGLPVAGLEQLSESTSKKHSHAESVKSSVSSGADGTIGAQRNIQSFFSSVRTVDKNIESKRYCLDQTDSNSLEVELEVVNDDIVSTVDGKDSVSVGFFAKKLKDFNQLKSTSSLANKEPARYDSISILNSVHDAGHFSDASNDSKITEAQELSGANANHADCNSNVASANLESMSSDDFMECDKCGELISIYEMPEHSDFHFALKLQEETGMTSSAAAISGQSTSTAAKASGLLAVKRKSGSPSKTKRGGKKTKVDRSVQPLTVFFSKT
ncbi:hypothetical protein BsWGS_14983 [Bradybaena similaris]